MKILPVCRIDVLRYLNSRRFLETGYLALYSMSCCTGMETRNPPVIDADAVYVQKSNVGVRVVGEEGAVTPGESVLRIVDLDTASEPIDIRAEENGSFEVELEGGFDHLYHLRAEYEGITSKPVDLSGEFVQQNRCVEVEPPEILMLPMTTPGETERASVRLTNTCDADAVLMEQWVRLRAPRFEFQDLELPYAIRNGKSLTVGVTFNPSTSGIYESIVIYSFDVPGRIVVDVIGIVRPSGDSEEVIGKYTLR